MTVQRSHCPPQWCQSKFCIGDRQYSSWTMMAGAISPSIHFLFVPMCFSTVWIT
jgi:hypothetical protein